MYVYIIYSQISVLWFYNYKLYCLNNVSKNNTTRVFSLLCAILIGVCLGSFWANQELNWGGFWSWDPVELISLLLFLWFLVQLHNKNNIIFNKSLSNIAITIVLFYFVIRLGVVTTIHSFILSNLHPFFVYIFLLLIVIVFFNNTIKYYYFYKSRRTHYYTVICVFYLIVIYA